MELAPFPGTALYRRLEQEGRLAPNPAWRECHGQDRIWFDHPRFSRAESRRILDRAFELDYQRLGPSLLRAAETRLHGLDLIRPTDDAFLAGRFADLRRFAEEMKPLLWSFVTLAPNEDVRAKAREILRRYHERLGPFSLADRARMGLVNLSARITARRYRRGRNIHQPRTFLDRYRWTT